MSETTTRKPTFDDILAFSDAELKEFMKQHWEENVGFTINVDWSWGKLDQDQRDQLAERLKAGALLVDEERTSYPVDMDAVAARLREVLDEKDAAPPASSQSPSSRSKTPSTPLEDEYQWYKEHETRAYHDLVKNGGRPLYPISSLEEVLNDPEGHRELLLPWQIDLHVVQLEPGVFEIQLRRWRAFRTWQKKNREYTEEDRFAAFLEEFDPTDPEAESCIYVKLAPPGMTESQYLEGLRVEFERKRRRRRRTKGGAEDGEAAFAEFVRETKRRNLETAVMWPGMTEDESRQVLRMEFDAREKWLERFFPYERYYMREDHGRAGFPEYVDDVKRRLARHGFAMPFQLDRDPKRQDKLTTWIEYLNYEYAWLDRHEAALERRRLRHDEAWKKLVGTGVMRPGETPENIRSTEGLFGLQDELDRDQEVIESAKAAAKAVIRDVEKAARGRSGLTTQERVERLRTAHSRVVTAKEAREETMRRVQLISNFIQNTHVYVETKDIIPRHRRMLQWVLDQVPLIKAELDGSGLADDGSHSGRAAEEPAVGQVDPAGDHARPEKKRGRGQPSGVADDAQLSAEGERPPKRGRRSDGHNAQSSKRLGDDGTGSALASASAAMEEKPSEISEDHVPRSGDVSRPQATPERRGVAEGVGADATGTAGQTSSRPSRDGTGDVPKLRRSARIAARQARNPSTAAVSHSTSTNGSSRRQSRRREL
ncbi:hypothetical protein VTK73DRAFT_7838 [Phialemonium thermophilum]|uniref:Uncharacterized protein n=1 Tax=Phialemonium thermophilum TaxID=223376 RepID=A0ABR3WCN7_9PEZI